jgi:hypothetical protein
VTHDRTPANMASDDHVHPPNRQSNKVEMMN